MNKAIIQGNLGQDVVVRFTQQGTPVANMSVATNTFYKDKEGNRQKRVEWHRVVVWGKLAETCGQHLSKGRSVLVEGELRTRSWERDGVKRYSTEIHARNVDFGPRSQLQKQEAPSVAEDAEAVLDVEEVPF